MKKAKNLLIICAGLFCLLCFTVVEGVAQNQRSGNTRTGQEGGGTITGRILDAETGAPLEYATISVFHASDSSLASGATTNVQGEFTVQVPLGSYYARLQFLSYGSAYESNIELTAANTQVNLGSLELAPDSQQLEEVEVVAEKDQVQLALDKRVFNVGESLARVGGSASDILDNIPSVTVDVEGNVALRGSQNVQILIDGKPSGLVGISGTDALRSLPADMIERVEVVTNPSARYQAEGVAGIINIILKKDRRDGFNGSFSGNVGYPANTGASVNLNYRKGWYNLFANYGIRYYDFIGRGKTSQSFNFPDTSYSTEITRLNNRQGLSNNIRFGSDFFLNEFNTLSAAFLYRMSTSQTDGEVNYLDYNTNERLERATQRLSREQETEPTRELELNYRRTFEQQGQLLTASFQYRDNTEVEESAINEGLQSTTDTYLSQRTLNDEASRNFLFQADYTHPFNKEGRWEAGVRTNWDRNTNDYLVSQLMGSQWQELDSLTNNFIYTENVYAAYAILGDKPGKFSYQAGLRAEYSDINSQLLQTGDEYPRNYLSFFPTVHLTYELSQEKSIEWSYSRRIRRPGGRWLNPFISLEDNRNVRTGNPNLNPEFTNSVEIGYLQHLSFASITSSAYYRHTTDVMQRVTTTVPTDSFQIQITMPMNLATENSYGLEFVVNADIAKWWTTNTNFNFYRQIITGGNVVGVSDLNLNSDTYTWNARNNMQFKLMEGLSAQTTFFYRAPMERPQGRTKALYVADAGISKDLFGKKGNLTLSVSDLFNSRKWRSTTFGDNFISDSEFQWRPRTFTLGFTYQLRSSNKRGERPNRDQRQNDGGEDMDF